MNLLNLITNFSLCIVMTQLHRYVQIAISRKGFCRDAKMATRLIVNNALRIAAVNIISDMILFMGKVCGGEPGLCTH
jgi:hypothetical protein